MSKTIVLPSGETSSEIHDASSVVKLSFRVVMSGNALVLAAAFTALSFCAGVCAPSGAALRVTIVRVRPSRRRDIIERFSIHSGVAWIGDCRAGNDTRGRERTPARLCGVALG